jgi:hypothetical protein
VTDGTNSASATYTENPRIQVLRIGAPGSATCGGGSLVCPTDTVTLSSGFPDRTFSPVAVIADGFAASEGVSYSFTNAFTANPSSCTAGSTSATDPGECVSSTSSLTVAITAGGIKTVSATGGTSGLVASTTFTINPAVAFYNTQTGGTIFSFLGNTPTSVLAEGYGFTASSTIAANSITIGGVATSHQSISVGTDGTFGQGRGNHTILSPTTSVPLGSTSLVIQGNTFNWANGNIVAGAATDSNGVGIPTTGGASRIKFGWGSPIIASALGSGSSTATVITDSASYMPNTLADSYSTNVWGIPQDAGVTLIGAGFAASDGTITTPICTACGGLTWAHPTADPLGAFWAQNTGVGFGEAGQTVTNGPQTISITVSATSVANVVPPSFTIAPWIFLNNGCGSTVQGDPSAVCAGQNVVPCPTGSAVACAYKPQDWSNSISGNGQWGTRLIEYTAQAQQLQIQAHGFKVATGMTFTITPKTGSTTSTPGSTSIADGTPTTGSASGANPGAIYNVTPTTLSQFDLAAGAYTITGSDGQNTATDTFAVAPLANFLPVPDGDGDVASVTGALTLSSGPALTSTVQMRTGTSFGVHGLKASTAYTIYLGPWSGAATVGTFTSTSTGGIPLPGNQFTIPQGTVGNHILAIKETATGTDALFNGAAGTTIVAATTNCPITSTSLPCPTSGAPPFGTEKLVTGFNNLDPANVATIAGVTSDVPSLTPSIVSQYGDLIFNLQATVNVAPTVANVASTLTVSGNGLSPATTYYVSLASKSAGLSIGSATVSQFTTDASGNIPASSTFAFPALPSDDDAEGGTAYNIFISTGTQVVNGQSSGQGTFVEQGALFLSSNTAPAGSVVLTTGTGLGAGETYDIVFNYALSSSGSTFTGTIVGAFSTNALGSASSSFTVPAGTATGTYTIQLKDVDGDQTFGVLAIPPALTVGGSGGGNLNCQDTTCMALGGTPTITTLNGQKTIVATYSNTSNSTQTAIVYAVIHNANGQTVAYSTATITPAAKSTQQAFLVLFGLAPGTYSVSLFVTTTGGVAVSTSSTVSVTV